MTKRTKIYTLVECAIFVAIATVLSVIVIYQAPLGGAVTLFSMVPVIIISFRHGIKWGMGSAFVYSVLQLLLGMKSVMYVPGLAGIILCILLDYILAFTVLGLAGIFKTDKFYKIIFATLFVCLLRYICHVLSGAVVWYEITKQGQWNELVMTTGMWLYSIIYNISYFLPETVITLIGTPVIVKLLSIKKFMLDK